MFHGSGETQASSPTRESEKPPASHRTGARVMRPYASAGNPQQKPNQPQPVISVSE